jgi:hypothetical protein
MGWLLRHNWLWALLAFLLGAALTWFLLVRREQGEARAKAEQRTRKTAEEKSSVLVGAGASSRTSTGTPTAAPARRDPDGPAGGSPVAPAAAGPAKPAAVEPERPAAEPVAVKHPAAVEPERPAAGEEPVAVEEPAAAEVDVQAGAAPVSLAKRAPFSRRMEANGFAEPAEATLFDLDTTGDTTSGSASADPERAPDVVPESAELAAPGQEDGVPAESDEMPPGRYGQGSADAVPHQSPPDGFTIKGKAQSMLFHTPDSPYYGRTKPDVWFRTEAEAERAGFTKYVRKPRKSPDFPKV